MVNRNTWQSSFIRRCESVGWNVERTKSNHYKVTAGERFLFVFPTTPGDTRSQRNTEAEANRHGLLNLEQNLKLRNERERLQRIQDDRQKADAFAAVDAEKRIDDVLSVVAPTAKVAPPAKLGDVGGVEIVAIAPVSYRPGGTGETKPLEGGEELLLADHRVIYRCVLGAATPYKPNAEGLCHRTYQTPQHLLAHIRYHNRNPWKPTDKIDSRSNNAEETRETPVTKIAESNGHKSVQADQLDAALAQAQDSVKRIQTGFASLIIELGSIRDAVRKINVADAETIEKAAQFDALGAIFKNAAGK